MNMTIARNVAIVLVLAAAVAFIPGGGTTAGLIGAILSTLIIVSLVFFAYRFYREHRVELDGLGDRWRGLLYGAIAAVVLALGPELAARFGKARLGAVLAASVVEDEALRRHALAWCAAALAKRGSRRPAPPRDEHFARVEQAARVLLGLLDRSGSVLPPAPAPT